MNASFYPVYTSHVERQKDFMRRAEQTREVRKLRREARTRGVRGRRVAALRDSSGQAGDLAVAGRAARRLSPWADRRRGPGVYLQVMGTIEEEAAHRAERAAG